MLSYLYGVVAAMRPAGPWQSSSAEYGRKEKMGIFWVVDDVIDLINPRVIVP